MQVLLSGGTGLIGSALVQSLCEHNHEVTVLTRSPERKPARPLPNDVRLEKWDGTTAAGWGHLIEKTDAIVHLAGEGIADGRWTPARKRQILESRINGGKALVAAIQEATTKPKVLVQSSAVGYYGPQDDKILTEDDPPGSDFLARVCFDWEASTAAIEAMGVRRPIIRTGVVLSSQGGAFPKMVLPFRLLAGGPIGSGNQYFPWIHIRDVVEAVRFLLEKESASGPYNLTAPNPPQNKEFVKDIGRAMGRPSWMPAPSFALRVAFGEMSTVLLDGQRAIPAHLQADGFEFAFQEAVAAIRDVLQNRH